MQFPGLDLVLLSMAIKHWLMSPPGLAQVTLCMSGMVHSRERGKGELCWQREPFTRERWRSSVILSTGTDHRSLNGLSPESSPVRGNFLSVVPLGFEWKVQTS